MIQMKSTLVLTSPGFKMNGEMPKRFTGEGRDLSPELRWSEVPSGTHSFAILCEDPDAPKSPGKDHPYVHWVAYNISPSVTMVPEGILGVPELELPVLMSQGINSFGKIGYEGPMPPPGHGRHRYFFRLFALEAELGLRPGLKKQAVLKAMQGHVLAQAELVGTYLRETKLIPSPTRDASRVG